MEYAFRNTLTRFMLVLGVLALLTGVVWAQGGSGELQGLVTDPSGAVVANAQVALTNSATGEKRTTATTNAGIYRFVAVPVVGTYTLEMSPKGFKSAKVAGIVISVGTVVNQDIHLELGATTEQVTVEAGAQMVQTSDAAVSGLVDRRVWQQMPLETRGQNDFINLFAGSVSGAVALNADNGGTDRGAAVNGTRSGSGNYLVEGFDNNDQGLGGGGSLVGTGGANTTISPDAIQEYRVIEHNFSAEYGKAGGFVTDTVLKSGTNQWHGSLFEYNRIQALAANSFFSNRSGVKDSLVRNQFGGSVGGAIVKDKTFFYFTTEIHRRRQATPLSADAVTPDFLKFVDSGGLEQFAEGTGPYAGQGLCFDLTGASCPGKFADSATLGPVFKNLIATQNFPLCVPGSSSCNDSSTFTSATFGNADANACLARAKRAINPIPCKPGLTNYYPFTTFGLLTVPQPDQLNQTRYTGKFDHKLSNNDQLNVAYLYDNADETTALNGGSSFFGPDLTSHGRAQNAGVTWSHTFSPTVLNQARVSYVRHTGDFPADPKAFAAGIPALFTAFDPGGNSLGNASNLPQFFTENEFVYKDDLSVTKGKHNFKGGGQYSRTRNQSDFQADKFGVFSAYTIQDLATDFKYSDNADFAFYGAPYYGSWFYAEAAIDPSKHPATVAHTARGFRANEVAAYFQDDWRILPRLTVNLGVRWEYFGPPHNFQKNLDSNFYSGVPITPLVTTSNNPFMPVNNPVVAAFSTGTLQIKNSDIWHKDTNNWAPRFGFAYDAFGNQKLVIRGGAGIAYDRMYNNIFENIRFNPPFFCFCNFGAFINGTAGGAIDTPGVYAVPFHNQAAFNDPNILPVLPKTSPRAVDQNLVTAYYEQANFGFQYELRKDFVLETNYVGTWGRKLLGVINLNTFDGRTAGAGFNSTRVNPAVNNINLRTNGFNSNYNALQVTLRKSYSYGLQFQANYTYAKALDEISDTFTPRGVALNLNPQNSLNTGLDYGPADFNVKHRFVFSTNYDLPFFKSNRWLGGWSASGIVTLQGGVPFSLTDGSTGYDLNKNGTFNDRISYIGPGSITHALTGRSAADGFFDPAQFAPTVCPGNVNGGLWCDGPAVGQTLRNTLIGPTFQNVDLGIAKKFKITESAAIQFQANFFNLFNRANFNLPQGDFNNTNFGLSTSTLAPGAGGARVTQLALRFDF